MDNKKIKNAILILAAVLALGALVFFLRSAGTDDRTEPMVVAEPAAVFLTPDREWTRQMKETYGKENYDVVAKGARDYQSRAEEFLKSKNMKIIYTEADYVEFLRSDGEKAAVDRVTAGRQGWGLYLFNGRDNPVDASAFNVEAKYESYFGTTGQ